MGVLMIPQIGFRSLGFHNVKTLLMCLDLGHTPIEGRGLPSVLGLWLDLNLFNLNRFNLNLRHLSLVKLRSNHSSTNKACSR